MSVPGSAVAVDRAAAALHEHARVLDRAGGSAVRSAVDSWRGDAADAFRSHQRRLRDQLADVGDVSQGAAGVLTAYAATLRAHQAEASAAGERFHDLAETVRRHPLDVVAALGAVRARLALSSIVSAAQRDARQAAQELLALVGEDGWGQSWWDPFGWWDDESVPDRAVGDDILDAGSFDPDSVRQGAIGDCYLLSSVMALLRTDRGDEWVRQNIRWDSARDGYWVTLYPDGEATEYFVDAVYGQGVADPEDGFLWFDSDRPGVASLIEAAAAQVSSYDDIDDGGVPADAISLLTGRSSEIVGTTSDGYQPYADRLREVLAGDGAIVASSYPDVPAGGETHHAQAQRLRSDGTLETFDVEIATSHAYMVDRIEPDGSVWVRNPWGEGNAYDDGVPFRLSPADFGSIYYRVSVGEVP